MDHWASLRVLARPSEPSLRALCRFVGTDGSMGLRTGQYAFLRVYRGSDGMLWAYWDDRRCPYETTGALARNWRLVHVLD